MRALVIVALIAGCTERAPHPIASVNPVIGDTSFIRAFGRPPTPADDPQLRVATHLAYVEHLLRARDVSALAPALRASRATLLDAFHAYIVTGAFPTSETDVGLLPTFLDAHTGVRCAVAYLVERSAGTEMMSALDRDHHNDYIAELEPDARFAAWADRSGFTRDELALIQPSYPPRAPLDLELGAAIDYQRPVDRDALAVVPDQLGFVRGHARYIRDHNRWLGAVVAGLDAAVGAADGSIAYDAHAKLGSMLHTRMVEAGATVGAGVDAAGAIARAWTFPIDTFFQYPLTGQPTKLAGVHGGVRLSEDRPLGWNAGVDFTWRDLVDSESGVMPRDLRIDVDVNRLAGALFVGLAIGFNSRTRYDWWER